jgi:hypothetical protein
MSSGDADAWIRPCWLTRRKGVERTPPGEYVSLPPSPVTRVSKRAVVAL